MRAGMKQKQLHAGEFRGSALYHSDDGGLTWWGGRWISQTALMTRAELVELAASILRDLERTEQGGRES